MDESYIGWIRRCLPDMCCFAPRHLRRTDRRELPPGYQGPRLARTRPCVFQRTKYSTWPRPAMVTRIQPDGKGRLTRPPRTGGRRITERRARAPFLLTIDRCQGYVSVKGNVLRSLCFRINSAILQPPNVRPFCMIQARHLADFDEFVRLVRSFGKGSRPMRASTPYSSWSHGNYDNK